MLATTSAAAPRRRRGPRRAGRPDRPAPAGAVVGERGQGRRQALLRPGAGRGGRSSWRPVGHRAPRSTCTAIERPTPDLVDVDVTVSCTAGTYIRAIARDVGAALGVGGHLTALRRTVVRARSTSRGAPPVEEAGGGAGRRRGSGRPAAWPTRPARSSRPASSPPRRRSRSATGSGSRPPAPRACTPRSPPTAGWSPWSRTPGRPPGSRSASRPLTGWQPAGVSTLDDRLAALDAELAAAARGAGRLLRRRRLRRGARRRRPRAGRRPGGRRDRGLAQPARRRARRGRRVRRVARGPARAAAHRRAARRRLRRQRRRPVRVLQVRAGRRARPRWPPSSASPTSSPAPTPTTCGPASGPASGRPPSAAPGRRWPGPGMTKDDVRAAARRWGLPLADKPAAACLASRIAYGVPVSAAGLARVEQAEASLRAALAAAGLAGARPARARPRRRRGPGRGRRRRSCPRWARSCWPPSPASTGSSSTRAGFRSGSMNELLPDPVRYR